MSFFSTSLKTALVAASMTGAGFLAATPASAQVVCRHHRCHRVYHPRRYYWHHRHLHDGYRYRGRYFHNGYWYPHRRRYYHHGWRYSYYGPRVRLGIVF